MSASPIRRVNGARSGSIRVGLLGLGTIGRAVARALVGGLPGVVLAGAMSRDAARARGFLATLPGPPPRRPSSDDAGAARFWTGRGLSCRH